MLMIPFPLLVPKLSSKQKLFMKKWMQERLNLC